MYTREGLGPIYMLIIKCMKVGMKALVSEQKKVLKVIFEASQLIVRGLMIDCGT